MKTVLCMKWGSKYGPDYANKLFSMVQRHLSGPLQLICFTDDAAGLDPAIVVRPLPEVVVPADSPERGWRKVGLFHPQLGLAPEPTLYLDLDVVVTGSLDVLFTEPGQFLICDDEDWRKPGVGNSSVFRFVPGEQDHIWQKFQSGSAQMMRRHRNEQEYVSAEAKGLKFWPATYCRSFKRHCLRGKIPFVRQKAVLPEGARVLIFHGDPKPEDAIVGRSAKFYRRFAPADWLGQYWR